MASAAAATVESFFPVNTLGQLRDLFQHILRQDDPDLTLCSVVLGQLEHQWTQARVPPPPSTLLPSSAGSSSESTSESDPSPTSNCMLPVDPTLHWSQVEALVARFQGIIKGYCDPGLLERSLNGEGENEANVRKLIKHVADIVWNTLAKNHYKDRPHLQSIFSYLTGNKLDCFGVAYAVVAACQLLSVPHVHLALSEDHAWVVFGADGTHTAEVTWHGKGSEDKRGQPVEIAKAKSSWLYAAGQPVVCDRHMEVAAAASSVNFAISSSVDSIECGAMQQEVLWLLYDGGHLKQYPMALGNLGDLEEISPSLGRPSCAKIFSEAIDSNRRHFDNQHVYPYTYQAGFYYRSKEFKKALGAWADAADVIKRYKYSKDDEEIYKEFLEIANELIPHLVKTAAADPKMYKEVLRDPECFAYILRFYDGICCWEEDSATPVLHIGWAKPMVSTCSKFESDVRAKVDLPKEENNDDDSEGSSSSVPHSPQSSASSLSQSATTLNNNNNNNVYKKDEMEVSPQPPSTPKSSSSRPKRDINNSGGDTDLLQSLTSQCKENILNVDFLLGKRHCSPFLLDLSPEKCNDSSSSDKQQQQDPLSRLRSRSRKRILRRQRKRRLRQLRASDNQQLISDSTSKDELLLLHLRSAKMQGLQGLLCSEKINTSAIQLQLTAQSQVGKGSKEASSSMESSFGEGRPKRARRE